MTSKVYFASDLHLGASAKVSSSEREKLFVEWLNKVSEDATEIHLLGDLFDFWFEYKRVVPKGGVRLLGAIAAASDKGIDIHWHAGNHDMWSFGYLEKEIGVTFHRSPKIFNWDGVKCLVGHGDGLGPGDSTYKFIKKLYTNRFCQWLLKIMHPNIVLRLANRLSSDSRANGGRNGGDFVNKENEYLYHYCKNQLASGSDVDLFIFGHRHIPLDIEVSAGNKIARYINTGDWLTHFSYAVLDAGQLELHK